MFENIQTFRAANALVTFLEELLDNRSAADEGLENGQREGPLRLQLW